MRDIVTRYLFVVITVALSLWVGFLFGASERTGHDIVFFVFCSVIVVFSGIASVAVAFLDAKIEANKRVLDFIDLLNDTTHPSNERDQDAEVA